MEILKKLFYVLVGITVIGWLIFTFGPDSINAGIYLLPAILASICVVLYLRKSKEK